MTGALEVLLHQGACRLRVAHLDRVQHTLVLVDHLLHPATCLERLQADQVRERVELDERLMEDRQLCRACYLKVEVAVGVEERAHRTTPALPLLPEDRDLDLVEV